MTGADGRPDAWASPRGLEALALTLAGEFPVYAFGTVRTGHGYSLSADHRERAARPGVYAVITSDAEEMRRALRDTDDDRQ